MAIRYFREFLLGKMEGFPMGPDGLAEIAPVFYRCTFLLFHVEKHTTIVLFILHTLIVYFYNAGKAVDEGGHMQWLAIIIAATLCGCAGTRINIDPCAQAISRSSFPAYDLVAIYPSQEPVYDCFFSLAAALTNNNISQEAFVVDRKSISADGMIGRGRGQPGTIVIVADHAQEYNRHTARNSLAAFMTGFLLWVPAPAIWYPTDGIISISGDVYREGQKIKTVRASVKTKVEDKILTSKNRDKLIETLIEELQKSLNHQIIIQLLSIAPLRIKKAPDPAPPTEEQPRVSPEQNEHSEGTNATAEAETTGKTIKQRMQELKALYDEGLIQESDYLEKKAEIINQL